MSLQFGTNQAQGPKYFVEELIYTGFPFAGSSASSLNTGTTNIFNASRWNPVNGQSWLSEITMVQATQNSGVALQWNADGKPNNGTGYTSALPANLRQERMGLRAVDGLSLSLNNTSGSAVSGFQMNYAVRMKRLMAADKLLAQMAGRQSSAYNLNAQEQTALQQLNMIDPKTGGITRSGLAQVKALVAKGTSPIGLGRTLNGLYDNHVVQEYTDSFTPSATSGDFSFATYVPNFSADNPTQGTYMVLTEVAVEGATNVTITVDRDGQAGYMQVNGAAFVQTNDEPWHCWLPATQYLTFHVTNGPGATGTLATNIRLKVLEIAMSEVVAVQFGLVHDPGQLQNAGTLWKTLAGIV